MIKSKCKCCGVEFIQFYFFNRRKAQQVGMLLLGVAGAVRTALPHLDFSYSFFAIKPAHVNTCPSTPDSTITDK